MTDNTEGVTPTPEQGSSQQPGAGWNASQPAGPDQSQQSSQPHQLTPPQQPQPLHYEQRPYQPAAHEPSQQTAQPGQHAQPGYQQGHYQGQAYSGPYQTNQHAPYGHGQQPPNQPPTGSTTTAPSGSKRHSNMVLVAALAIGALIGGASGAGVVGIYAASQPAETSVAAAQGPANITVNSPDDATVVTAVAAKASPSVVTISVEGSNSGGTGSGIILSSDGYVLTNTHVVTLDGQIANPSIQVTDNSGRIYSAKVIGTDPISDLAVIKLTDASGLSPATFADSSKLNVGDMAVAIGAPLGLSGTVTNGIVSSLNRSITIASSAAPKNTPDQGNGNNSQNPYNFFNFDLPGQPQQTQPTSTISLPVVQTDAAINPGNSGGPLLNNKGEVIGVNVAIASAGGSSSSSGQTGSIGVGFAVPANLAKRVADELISTGKASHGLLGASVTDATNDSSNTTLGAEIKEVTRGGAAAKAGLQPGDIVTKFNGIPITDSSDLTAQVRVLAGGSTADLTYDRGGQSHTVQVTLGELNQ